MQQNKKSFPAIFFKWRAVIAVFFSALILFSQSCKKIISSQNFSNEVLAQYFEANVLNRDFFVSLATDNGNDLTPQYNGYLFKLIKNTYFDGPLTGIKNGTTYSGTWRCNEDFSKLTISITQPAVPTEFIFLNREWRFTKKDLPTMQLAPWGSTDAKVLHMQRL